MRNHILLTLLLFFMFAAASAQNNITVKSFRLLEMDMTASSLEGKRIDQNSEAAALIKVVTSEKGFTFEAGALGVVDSQQRNGEIWVWVPRASRKITILHQQLGVLRDYRYPVEIQSERTYEMVLVTGKVETIVKEQVTQQYLAFKISPATAKLEVDGQLWEVSPDGSAMKFVNFGTYTYRVQAPNYHSEVGNVTVDDPENTQKVIVNLKPDFIEVTLKVESDAEIWVNNEKKGVRTWTGPLGKGIYKIECKQAGCETSVTTLEIKEESNGQMFILAAPRPMYGSLNVESTPGFATVFVDGKEMGETPKFIKEILVGQHELRLTKEGFADYTETVTVAKGERTQVNAKMRASGESVTVKPQQPKQQRPAVGSTNPKAFFVMANAAYASAPQTSFGLTMGSVRKIGWYMSIGTNFNFDASKDYECDYDGNIVDSSLGKYHFIDEQKTVRLSATAGMVFRLSDPLYAYVGAGYGKRVLLWRLCDTDYNYWWAQNAGRSFAGLALDAGVMLHFKGFGLSVGVQSIGVDYLEAKFGIGYTLKNN